MALSKLVIVESPAKAKTIARYLGPRYKVRASMGHVRDLPKSGMGVDMENGFRPTYHILAGRRKVVEGLRRLASKADEVYLATDLDREGEAIAWHLAQALKLPEEKTRRVVFNEITRDAIRASFEHPRGIDMNKVNAQQARRILDRIVGYELSPLLWEKVRRGLSAGRVQSVAVRLIVEREREIESFQPQEYWEIHADLAPEAAGEQGSFRARLTEYRGAEPALRDEAAARAVIAALEGQAFVVKCVETKETYLDPLPPFSTSTLQQQASVRLGFSVKKTMALAQQLYEGVELGDEGSVGLITYMRTDSLRVSEQAIADCRRYIGEAYPDCLPEKPHRYRSGRSAQEAHEAIRPTAVARTPDSVAPYLEKDLLRLYELIWKRFVASQMSPARFAVTEVKIVAGDAVFSVRGKRLDFDGHLRVAGYDAKDDVLLPPLEPGMALRLLKLEPSQHFTKPPPRYSEASLVRTLEKLGIGRPSTYAPIITTIQERGYVRLVKRRFHATDLGKIVTDLLVKHFSDVMSVEFTSRMEERLDEVEEARADWVETLRAFHEPFAADLGKARENMKPPEPEITEFKCPRCGRAMLRRWSRRGEFLGCSGYPECRYTQPLDEEGKPVERPEPQILEEKCPECGKPLVRRHSRHGPFIGCSGYPKCRYTRNVEERIELPEELRKCEKCGADMVIRRGRRGRFLSCSAYPKCRNAKPLPATKETAPPAGD